MTKLTNSEDDNTPAPQFSARFDKTTIKVQDSEESEERSIATPRERPITLNSSPRNNLEKRLSRTQRMPNGHALNMFNISIVKGDGDLADLNDSLPKSKEAGQQISMDLSAGPSSFGLSTTRVLYELQTPIEVKPELLAPANEKEELSFAKNRYEPCYTKIKRFKILRRPGFAKRGPAFESKNRGAVPAQTCTDVRRVFSPPPLESEAT